MTEKASLPRLGRAWWAGRSPRERLLLCGLAIFGGGSLLISGIVQPLLVERAAALAAIAGHERDRALLAAAPAGEAPERAAPRAAATAVLAESAAGFGLAILRMEPEGDGARLLLGDAAFEKLLGWIGAMQREHGLVVTALQVDRRPEPGIVGSQLSFGR